MHPAAHLDQPGANTIRAAVYQPVSTPDLSTIAPVHNVISYGADATGATESAPAIQAALNAAATAGGGVVLVPAGVYITSQILQIGSGVALQGAGMGVTTIRAANGFLPSQVGSLNGLSVLTVANNAGGSNIVISGLTFDGNQANISSFPGWADEADSHCLDLRNVDNLQISGIEIINAIRYSMFIVQCTHSYVGFCRIISGQESLASGRTQQDGIHLSGCRWCVVADNNVDTGTTAGVGDDAICLQALTSGAPVTDITVTGNVLRGGTRGITLVPYLDSIRNVTIVGNDIYGTQDDGILFNVTSSGPTCSNVTIMGNTLAGIAASGNGHGVNLQSIAAPGYQDVVISGNTVSGFANTTGFGIYAGMGSGLLIESNNFDAFTGIRIINIGNSGVPVTRFQILGNTLNASAAASGAVGVMVVDSHDGIISDNIINGNASPRSNGVQLLGISVGVTGVAVNANRISNWATGIVESNSGIQPDNNSLTSNLLYECATPVYTGGAHDLIANNSGAVSLTAQTVSSGTTIATAGLVLARVTGTGTISNLALQAGAYSGQMVTVVNEGSVPLTLNTAGMSRVADGNLNIISANTARTFIWDAGTSLWYRMG
jgi:polygalacturonase